jgi:hypothetical protein
VSRGKRHRTPPAGARPLFSEVRYLRLPPHKVNMLRFLLEAFDNLAYFTVVDPRACLVRLVHAPGAETELGLALESMRPLVDFSIMAQPGEVVLG